MNIFDQLLPNWSEIRETCGSDDVAIHGLFEQLRDPTDITRIAKILSALQQSSADTPAISQHELEIIARLSGKEDVIIEDLDGLDINNLFLYFMDANSLIRMHNAYLHGTIQSSTDESQPGNTNTRSESLTILFELEEYSKEKLIELFRESETKVNHETSVLGERIRNSKQLQNLTSTDPNAADELKKLLDSVVQNLTDGNLAFARLAGMSDSQIGYLTRNAPPIIRRRFQQIENFLVEMHTPAANALRQILFEETPV